MTKKDPFPDPASPSLTPEPACDTISFKSPPGVTLERIIDDTDEMNHLNQLISLNLEKNGGFTTPEAYFSMVQPILDLLESEIRLRYCHGMTVKDIKLIVQDWIDGEIAKLQKG